jgi:hypothetical protein
VGLTINLPVYNKKTVYLTVIGAKICGKMLRSTERTILIILILEREFSFR